MTYVMRSVRIVMFVCSTSVLACATSVEVDAADRQLISNARTWTFLRHDPPLPPNVDGDTSGFTYRVTSPLRNASKLDSDLSRFLTVALARHGFEYVESDADLYVHYRLSLRPRRSSTEVAFASNYVASHSYSPSYVVEGSDVVTRDIEEMRLELDLRETRGRMLWKGVYEETIAARQKLSLDSHIDRLVSRLPERSRPQPR